MYDEMEGMVCFSFAVKRSIVVIIIYGRSFQSPFLLEVEKVSPASKTSGKEFTRYMS